MSPARIRAAAFPADAARPLADGFEDAAIPMAVLDLAGRILRVNSGFAALLGLDAASLQGVPVEDLLHPDDRAASAAAVTSVAGGDVRHASLLERYRHATGAWVGLHAGIGRVLGIDGRPLHLVVHVVETPAPRDDADDERAAAALYRATFDQASTGLAHIGADGRIVRVNAACAALAGIPADDLVGAPVSSFTLPDDPEGARYEKLWQAVAGGELERARFDQPVDLEGRSLQVEVTVQALDGERLPDGLLLAEVVDITDRRAAQNAMTEESARLGELVAFQRELAAAATDRDRTAAMICAQLHAIAGGDGASVEVLEGDALVFIAEEGHRRHGVGFRLGLASLAGQALRARETLVCHDAESDPRVNRALMQRVGARSLVCIPVLDGRRAIGAFNVLSAEPDDFDAVVVARLEMLAALAAPFLASAQALEAEVYRDALTGLANRERLTRRLDTRLGGSWDSTTAGIVVLDLCGFSELNERLGHDAGDRLLVQLARSLEAGAGRDELPARVSSDRFGVLLPAVASLDEVDARAAQIAAAVARSIEAPAGRAGVEVTIGTAIADTTDVDGALLIREALDSLERAKASRRAA